MKENSQLLMLALFAQVCNQPEEAIRHAEQVEPMQDGEALAFVGDLLKWTPENACQLIGALVNNAIAGMVDNRVTPSDDDTDRMFAFLNGLDKQRRGRN